jgi:hypothetical protein
VNPLLTDKHRPHPSVLSQQEGTATHLWVSWHQVVLGSGQSHLPQLSLLFGHSIGELKQKLI